MAVPAIRLIILASVVIVVLATVGALAPTVERDESTRPVGAPPTAAGSEPRPLGEVVEVEVPQKDAIEATVGDTVVLSLTPDQADRLVVRGLNVEEELSADVRRTLHVPVYRSGTFKVRLTRSHRTVARIVVAEPATTAPRDRPSPTTPAPADPTPASVLP